MYTIDYPEILSMEEACEILSVGKSTIYQMLKNGEIDGAFRIGKVWKIPRKAISDYILKRMQENIRTQKNKK